MAQPTLLERTITNRVIKALSARGAFVIKVHGGDSQRRGLPDLIGCYRGVFFGIEMKRPGNHATPLQVHVLEQMRDAGAGVAVASSVEQALTVLDGIDTRFVS